MLFRTFVDYETLEVTNRTAARGLIRGNSKRCDFFNFIKIKARSCRRVMNPASVFEESYYYHSPGRRLQWVGATRDWPVEDFKSSLEASTYFLEQTVKRMQEFGLLVYAGELAKSHRCLVEAMAKPGRKLVFALPRENCEAVRFEDNQVEFFCLEDLADEYVRQSYNSVLSRVSIRLEHMDPDQRENYLDRFMELNTEFNVTFPLYEDDWEYGSCPSPLI